MRRLLAVSAAAVAGFVVLSLVYLALFLTPLSIGSQRYPDRDAVVRRAIKESGSVRWPASRVEQRELAGDSFVVERRWLGLKESDLRVDPDGTGWRIDASPTYGPGKYLQVLLAAVLPAAIVAWWVFTRIQRRRRRTSAP